MSTMFSSSLPTVVNPAPAILKSFALFPVGKGMSAHRRFWWTNGSGTVPPIFSFGIASSYPYQEP